VTNSEKASPPFGKTRKRLGTRIKTAFTSATTSVSNSAAGKQQVYFYLIIVALVLYCFPLILIAWEYIYFSGTGTPIDPNAPLVKWFVRFATSPGQPGDVIHKILIPLITFVAASSFATAHSTRRTMVLSLLILFFIFVAIGMDVAFQVNLSEEADNISQFFGRLEGTLATYLMLILGLQVAGSTATSARNKEKAHTPSERAQADAAPSNPPSVPKEG
jgi:hypothetical protein